MQVEIESNLKASEKKKRLYILLLIFQALLVSVPMLLQELIIQERVPFGYKFLGLTQLLLVLILLVVNSLFVKEFIENKWGFMLVVTLNCFGFIISATPYIVPAAYMSNHELNRILNILAHCCILSTLFFTFYGAVKDIFRLRHNLTYSLLGAANIFLLIGFIFSFIINISGSVFVGMVLPIEQIIVMDTYTNKVAFYSLASMDPPFDNINPFIKDLLVYESIFAHLFVVMIVGRLLSK